jgi:transaldolase
MKRVSDLKVKIFGDGADKAAILDLYAKPYIHGFTTNPTLMRKAGIRDYEFFARDLLQSVPDRPVSFEVFADEFDEMERQARRIATWGPNVFAKIPITNTRRESSVPLLRHLTHEGLQLNVTALLPLHQVRAAAEAMCGGPPCYISVFAGRIADTGVEPVPLMAKAVELLAPAPNLQLIWASPRELLNIIQADEVGCHVITVSGDLLRKLDTVLGKDLDEYSLDTVRMFHEDARASGFQL